MSKIIVRDNVTKIIRPAPLVDDAYGILQSELRRFSAKSKGVGLDDKDVGSFRKLVQCIVELNKEERAQQQSEALNKQLESMSTEELLQIAQDQLKSDGE